MNVLDRIFVVMPLANEERSTRAHLESVLAAHPGLVACAVMDHFSKDRTQQIVEELERSTNRRVRLVFFEESTGVASCYLEGFRYALREGATAIIEMDGGGSHRPEEIPRFLGKLAEGYDCVFGSKFLKESRLSNNPLYRTALSYGGTVLANRVLGTGLADMTSGYEAFRADVLARLDLGAFLSRGHMFQTEMKYYCRNLNVAEIPIHYVAGESTLRLKSVTDALKILFQLSSQPNAHVFPKQTERPASVQGPSA